MVHYKRATLVTPETLNVDKVVNVLVSCYGDRIAQPPINQSSCGYQYYRMMLHTNCSDIQSTFRDMQVSCDSESDHQDHPELSGCRTTLLLGCAAEEETTEILTTGGYAIKEQFGGNLFIFEDNDKYILQLH